MRRGPALVLALCAAGALVVLGARRCGAPVPATLPSIDAATPRVSAPPSPGPGGADGPALRGDGGPSLAAAPLADGGAPRPGGGAVVVHGAWGAAPGQFGRKREPESNPEAPMAIAVGEGGEVAVVDQVNRRLQRFAGGRLVGTLAFGSDTIQDLALGPGGRTVLLDRLAEREVQVYDRAGRLENEVPLEGQGVPEGGGVTGVFADQGGIFVEREHSALVRIADAEGRRVDRSELPGRPTRDGRLLLAASIGDRAAGTARVRAFDRGTLAPAWDVTVPLGAPLVGLLLLDSDGHGRVYVGGTIGHESSEPPYRLVDEGLVVIRLSPAGQPSGRLHIAVPRTPDETFRDLAVDADGNVYAMEPGADGLDVVRYSF